MPPIVRLLGLLILTAALPGVIAAKLTPMGLKRGQQSVDRTTLPFVSLTFVQDSSKKIWESVTFESLPTKKKFKAILGKMDMKNPDILTAFQEGRFCLQQAIVRLPPGVYRVTEIEVIQSNGLGNRTVDLKEHGSYQFTVQDGCLNYLGSIVVGGDNAPKSPFKTIVSLQDTAERDARWAEDLIPAVAGLPAVSSPIMFIEATPKNAEFKSKKAVNGAPAPLAPPETYHMGLLDEHPRTIFQIKPEYPLTLRKRGITGTALVEFIITTTGDVAGAFAVRATHPLFAEAAVEAVSQFKFHPGRVGGRPVNTRVQQAMGFTLKE